MTAKSSWALRSSASGELSSARGCWAPITDAAVRHTSMGWHVVGSSSITRLSSGVRARFSRSRVRKASSSSADGSSPFHSSRATSSAEHFSASSCTG